ncbi:MAG: MFS transporter [Puia sp.]
MRISTFSAFKSRNYRLYFVGQSISLLGTWMQKTAVSWVVYTLTHSKFMLGVTLFATLFPSFIFSFLGGVVSDRYNRYKLLLLTQIVSMIQALLLTALIFFKQYTVWEILALSVLLGIINAFDVPARQSLVYEMVKKKDLPNALALNSSMVNLSRLIGPAIAGLVIEKWGNDVCFGLNSLSFVAVIFSLFMMRLPRYIPNPRTKNVLEQVKDGLAYIAKTPDIAFILKMLALISFFVIPFGTLIPVYAKDIFHGTASTFGIIDSFIGLGAFSGALFLASLKPGRNLRRVLAINTFVFGSGLILFSHIPYYPLALFFAAVAAFGMMSQFTISNTIIQTTVDSSMRGRVISLYAMVLFGMQPLGALLIGLVSEHIGVKNTVMIQGFIALVIGWLHIRNLKRNKIRRKRTAVPSLEKQPAAVALSA